MKESIGATWVMQLVIAFIFLFVAFLAITISYSKSFKVKNEATSIIEKYGGFNDVSKGIIDGYLQSSGYSNRGHCNIDKNGQIKGITDFGANPVDATKGGRYLYCVRKESIRDDVISNVYYEVTFFYKFDLPLVGNSVSFQITGKTTDMVNKVTSGSYFN